MARSFRLSSNSLRANLKAHSGLGLFIAALLYLVCMTGVVSVYYPDIEQWEQADIAATQTVTPAQIQAAVETIYEHHQQQTGKGDKAGALEDIWVNMPTTDMPRFIVGAAPVRAEGEAKREKLEFHLNSNGSLGPAVAHEWTHFVVKLHYALTLPGVWGITLVGVIGMVLVAMTISGILAHPNIFKDAFALRINRGARQQQVDMHNRIGVWATPFILAIALTGALIGLSQVLLFTFATGFHKGDTTAISNQLYMPHPQPTHEPAPLLDVAPIVEKFQRDYPHLNAYFLAIHYPATTAQAVEIGAYVPNRLAWYDAVQYNAAGEETKRLGWPDGDLGMQIYASTYRLHFGHFGGVPVKILYTLLGLGLCFICATGMNIWFRRQQQAGNPRAVTERLWLAAVWGFPCALVLTGISSFWWPQASVALFWGSSVLLAAGALVAKSRHQVSIGLRLLLITLIAGLLTAHIARFGSAALSGASLLVNGCWLIAALALIVGLKPGLPLATSKRQIPTETSSDPA